MSAQDANAQLQGNPFEEFDHCVTAHVMVFDPVRKALTVRGNQLTPLIGLCKPAANQAAEVLIWCWMGMLRNLVLRRDAKGALQMQQA